MVDVGRSLSMAAGLWKFAVWAVLCWAAASVNPDWDITGIMIIYHFFSMLTALVLV